MMQQDFELIEDFFREEITVENRAIVLERLKTDTEFRTAFLLEKQQFENYDESNWSFMDNSDLEELNAYEALFKSEQTQRLKASIQEASAQYHKTDKTPSRKWMFYAAAAILVLMFSVYSILDTKDTPQQLFSVYFNPDELPGLAVRGANEDDLLLKAERFFNEEQYSEAIPLMDQSMALMSKNAGAIYLYKGISHMEIGQFDIAETTFNSLIESDLLDAQKGYWYKALLYLKTNRSEDAKVILQEIVSENYVNKEKAAKILEELE